MKPAPTLPPGGGGSASLTRQVLQQATALARKGRLEAAGTLLKTHCQEAGAPVEVLVLLGRIHAQQGRLLDAESCWRQALQADPTHSGAMAAVERLKQLHGRRSWKGALLMVAAVAACVAVVVMGARWVTGKQAAATRAMRDDLAEGFAQKHEDLKRELSDVSARLESLASEQPLAAGRQKEITALLASLSGRLQEIQRFEAVQDSLRQHALALSASVKASEDQVEKQVRELGVRLDASVEQAARQNREEVEKLAAAIPRPPAPPPPLNIAVPVAGVSVAGSGDEWIISFHEPLFEGGAALSARGRELLEAVARALARTGAPLAIQAVGRCGVSPAPPPETLPAGGCQAGLARSVSVIGHLAGLGLLKEEGLSAAAAPPLSGNSVGEEGASGEVILKVSRRK